MQILGSVHGVCSEAAELLPSADLDASPADINASAERRSKGVASPR